MAAALLLRAMHVRIPLTRNNLLSFPPFSSSSYSFQSPATSAGCSRYVRTCFARVYCSRVLPCPLPRFSQTCDLIRRIARKTEKDVSRFLSIASRQRFANFRRLRYIWQREISLAPNRRQRGQAIFNIARAMAYLSFSSLVCTRIRLYIRDSLVLHERYTRFPN